MQLWVYLSLCGWFRPVYLARVGVFSPVVRVFSHLWVYLSLCGWFRPVYLTRVGALALLLVYLAICGWIYPSVGGLGLCI